MMGTLSTTTATLELTSGDHVAAVLLAGAALVGTFYLLVFSPRARRAAQDGPRRPRTPRERAMAAAASVESHGHDFWFQCSCCKQRRLERGLEWPEFVERLTDPSPVCRGCADDRLVLLEQEMAS